MYHHRLGRFLALVLLLLALPSPAAPAQEPALPQGFIHLNEKPPFYHGRHIHALTRTLDGKTLYAAFSDGRVIAWDVASGKQTAGWQAHAGAIKSLALSPDGKQLATSGADRLVRLWDPAGKELRQLNGSQGTATALAYAPDGKTLAVAGEDRAIYLCDSDTGDERRQILGHPLPTTGLAFTPDGKALLSVAGETNARLWDVVTGREIRRYAVPTGINLPSVNQLSLAIHPDGTKALLGGSDGIVRAWELATGKETAQFKAHPSAITQLVLSADGKQLASAGSDLTLRLWDPATGQERHRLGTHSYSIPAIVFAPDGQVLHTGTTYDAALRHWDTTTGKERSGSHGLGWIRGLAFLPDGKSLAVARSDGSLIALDFQGKEVYRVQGHGGPLANLALSPDGKTLVTGTANAQARVLNAQTGEAIRPLPGASSVTSWFCPLALSPDGKQVSFLSSGTIVHWDPQTATHRGSFRPGTITPYTMAYSPDGKILATGGGTTDFAVTLNDPTGATPARRLTGHTQAIAALAFSPDGQMLASWSADRSVRLWDVATNKERRVFFIGPTSGVIGYSTVTFSPDGRLLAAGHADRTVRVWEILTGQEILRSPVQNGSIRAIEFSRDSRRLAFGGDDGLVTLVDITASRKPRPAPGAALTKEELDEAWAALGSTEGTQIHRGMALLARDPAAAVATLRQKVSITDEQAVLRLIKELDDDEFEVRQKASDELEKLGRTAEGSLRKALGEKPPPEMLKRLQELLAKLDKGGGSTEVPRWRRVVELLERLETAESQKLLEELAKGSSLGSVAAKEALQRREKIAPAIP